MDYPSDVKRLAWLSKGVPAATPKDGCAGEPAISSGLSDVFQFLLP
jgi:hypothetical protein